MASEADRGHANLVGAAWLVASAFAATFMSSAVKALGETLETPQIVFARFVVGMALVVLLTLPRANFSLRTRRPWLHLSRGLLGIVAINVGYWSLTVLPLVTATVLFFTAPLWVTLLAIPLLGEKVGWRRALATAFGFVGAMVVIGLDAPAGGTALLGMLAALSSSLLFGVSLVLGKRLATTEPAGRIMFYFTLVGLVGSAPWALLTWVPPNGSEWLLLIAAGAFAAARTYADIRAFASGEASFVAIFTYTRIIFIAAAGYLFFGESPTTGALIGLALIVSSTIYVTIREARLRTGR